MNDRLARKMRVREGAARGIRPVPKNPDPRQFPPIPFACDVRPTWCSDCHVTNCPHGIPTVPLEELEEP